MSIAEARTRAEAPARVEAPSAAVARRQHKWTIAEFDRMVTTGILREQSGGPFLWDGEVLEPMPENRPHVNSTENLRDELAQRLSKSDWTIDQDHPLVLREGYKPNPDLSVLIGPRSNYRRQTPVPSNVALLVEVSDTSYHADVGEMLYEFSKVGIPQYWVVWIDGRCVRVFREPDGAGRYRVEQTYKLGEMVPLELAAGEARHAFEPIPVEAILRDSQPEPEPGPPSGGGAASS